jgi:hypothetical protein
MEPNNQLKSNLGLILLSVSVIIGCLLLREINVRHQYQDAPSYAVNESKIRLTGDIAGLAIPVSINTNGNDVTYNSELKVGNGEKLVIQSSNGTQEIIEGQNIIAAYYHVAKLLTVEFVRDGKKSLKYFNAPIKWGNEK